MTAVDSATCPHCGTIYTSPSALRLAQSCAASCARANERAEVAASSLWHVSGDQWASVRARTRT